MKSIILVLTILLGVLQYKLWFEEGGVIQALRLQNQIEKQTVENITLADRNHALTAEITDLKNGQEAIIERARTELGLVKQGETFYQLLQ